jgi:diguanylate cyclase (GGDEF)-like protein
MKSVPHTVQDLLLAVHHRMQCMAAAFMVSPGTSHFHSDSVQDAVRARELIERTAESFFEQCQERREAVIRNRVREFSGGPLIGRFLAMPVRGASAEILGILLLFNDAHHDEFTPGDARLVARYARLFSKAIVAPRDPLTGLLRRAAFEKRVSEHHSGTGPPRTGALLYGDIDQLHVINDLWGFEMGDRAICNVAEQMQAQLAPHNAVLSRLSGDRFTVFVPDCTLAHAREIADQIRAAVLTLEVNTAMDPVFLSMSWGVAMLRVGEDRLDHGLAAAEIACKAAKDRGRNRVEVYQDTDASIIRRRDDMLIIGRLRTALTEGRFQVFGQPIAPLLQHEPTRRYEMLLRLIDENDALVLPARFMSAATRYQLLPQLDRCVISHVLGKLKAARSTPGFLPVHASINLSGPTISEPDFMEWLLNEIQVSGVPGDWLSFELTETAAVGNLQRAQVLIDQMGQRGCRFALDDFGTGLSSLAHLKTLNFSMLKIDGSFVRDLLVNERSASLVRAVAQLANSMGIETVAEYVETAEICMRLIELQVQFGQGFALGRPVKLERILGPGGASNPTVTAALAQSMRAAADARVEALSALKLLPVPAASAETRAQRR